jgi:hypothetical protein
MDDDDADNQETESDSGSQSNSVQSLKPYTKFSSKSQFVFSYFVKLDPDKDSRACSYCQKVFDSNKSFSLEYHLTKFHSNDCEMMEGLLYWQSETKSKRPATTAESEVRFMQRKRSKVTPSHTNPSRGSSQPTQAANQANSSQPITKHFKPAPSSLKDDLSEATALFFSMHDAPLSWAQSPYLLDMLIAYHKAATKGVANKLDGREKLAEIQSKLAETII